MASKSFIVLGLLLAALLVVSTAREMTGQPKEAPTKTTHVEESKDVATDGYNGGGGGYGGGHGGYGGGRGGYGGGYGGYGGGRGGYGGGRGGYGGGRGGGGGCHYRCHGGCCTKAEFESETQTQN